MKPLLSVENLKMHFPVKGGVFLRSVASCKAVDGVSLTVHEGETLGLVGESGCGKSTLGKCMVRLLEPTGGRVEFEGADITHMKRSDLLPRRRELQMMFQDPAESLNPRHTVGEIVSEPFVIHGIGDRQERVERVGELLEKVGLSASAADRFPFEFSGGQRQRIGIARAIALNPRMIICDEPVSALDVSVQSQVLNLMMDLQSDLGLSYLFIAHDLAVVRHVSNRVAIMYLGKIMEVADADAIYENPRHAYTKALISAIPIPDPKVQKEPQFLEGDVPSPINPPEGCAFGHRTAHADWEKSIGMDLSLREVEPGHWVQPCPCCTDL
ncbi:MAG: ATP-binding cassette domain-containing protein [Verrucomicrobiales bacterium]|nr:ATP-binding cassette domain-containing protein [Verrucomicrobiales bacterium]